MLKKALEGKTAIVTGSGQGIGRCIALCLAEHGAKVITNNRKRGSSINAFERTELEFTEKEKEELRKFSGDAQTTVDEITAKGGEAFAVFGDISNKADAGKLVKTAIDHWGRIDIIVNNASSNWVGSIMDMDEEIWELQIASKLSGTFYLTHYALPYMKEQGFGRILNSASDAFLGLSGYAAYGAGNAGVVAFTKAVAKDVSGTGITVNAYTPLARTRSWYNAKTTYRIKGVPPEVIEANAPEAMKRTAEGMAPFLVYLASDDAGGVTGNLFKLAADGVIGIWSDSEVVHEIKQNDGFWTLEELKKKIPEELLKDTVSNNGDRILSNNRRDKL
jgi:3-oxoacyl-[acyl-carrier protein] reductase